MRLLVLWAGGVGLACLLLAGCGGGYQPPQGVVVTGTVLQGGQPLDVPRRDVGLGMVEIKLAPVAGGPPIGTLCEEDGSFEIRGAGDGVPAGQYRLAVYQRDQGPTSDKLQDAFSTQNSPIIVDVPQDKLGGTLDMGVVELDKYKK